MKSTRDGVKNGLANSRKRGNWMKILEDKSTNKKYSPLLTMILIRITCFRSSDRARAIDWASPSKIRAEMTKGWCSNLHFHYFLTVKIWPLLSTRLVPNFIVFFFQGPWPLCYGTDFATTAQRSTFLFLGLNFSRRREPTTLYSAVAGSQLLSTLPLLAANYSLLSKNWRLSMCSLRHDWSTRVARS